MSKTKAGGPAFPCGEKYQTRDLAGNATDHSKAPLISDMTLRDYFAAKALQGCLAKGEDELAVDFRAQEAYALADAMLKAREA